MAQLHEREEKFDSFLNKIIILSSKYYYKKQMRINGRENTIIDNEEYSQFLQKFITEKDTFSSVERIDTSLQLKKALESLSAIEQAVIFLLFQRGLRPLWNPRGGAFFVFLFAPVTICSGLVTHDAR